MIDYLLQCGANLAHADKEKMQALHKAVSNSQEALIRILCELGCCEMAEANPGGVSAFDYVRRAGLAESYITEWVVMPTKDRFETICDRWLPYLDRAVDRVYRKLVNKYVALCTRGRASPIGTEGHYLMRLCLEVPMPIVKKILLKNLSEEMGVLDLVGNLQGLYSLKEGAEVPLPHNYENNDENDDNDDDDEDGAGGGGPGFDALDAFHPEQQPQGPLFGNLVAPAHQPQGGGPHPN